MFQLSASAKQSAIGAGCWAVGMSGAIRNRNDNASMRFRETEPKGIDRERKDPSSNPTVGGARILEQGMS